MPLPLRNASKLRLAAIYGVALAALALAVLARWALDSLLEGQLALVTLYGAIAYAGWLGGVGPAITVAIPGYLICDYLFIPPRGSLFGSSTPARMIAYLLTSALIVVIIEALRRTKNQVSRQAEMLRTTLLSIGDAVVATDEDGRVTFLNPVADQLTGWSTDEARGKLATEVLNLINEQSRLPVENPVEKALRSQQIVGMANHTILISRDGVEHPIDDSAAPIRDASGAVAGAVIVFRNIAERQLADRTRAHLAAIVQSSEDAIVSKSLDGVIQSWNAGAERIFGHSSEEAVGKPISLIIPPELLDEESNILARLKRGETIDHFETERVAKNGNRLKISLMISPVRDASGAIIGASKIARDITQRKLSEKELRDSEQRLRLALEAGRMGTWEWNIETGQVVGSPSLEALHGLKPGALPDSFEAYQADVHPEDKERVRDAISHTLASGQDYHVEYRIIWPDGGLHWIEGRGKLLRDDAGMPLRMIGVCTDITERKRWEAELRTSEQLYRAIGESIDYGVWICDPHGRNFYASESFLKLVGLTQEECSDLGWSTALHPDDVEPAVAAWMECVRSGETWDYEYRFRGADGQWHPVLARGVPVRNEHSEITAWAGIHLDISRLKQVEEELRDADRRKDEFLATLAHELRNPLAPIRNALEVTKHANSDGKLLRTAHQMMERQLGHLVRLVDDLLDVSRITRDRLELRRERVELASIIYQAIESCRPLLEEQRHELSVKLPDDPVYVDADAVRLAQVFSNLINNACKYTEPGGRITIIAEHDLRQVTVRVSDNGLGIEPDKLSQVFDMFAQMDQSLEKSQGGLGIGLTLVKRLVEMHGGNVAAASEGLDRGSEFTVRLPVMSGVPKVEAGDPPKTPHDVPCRRILIVDDNKDAAKWLALLLKSSGHKAFVAHDGVEAMQMAEQCKPDILLMDIGLPNMNGYDVCREIRKRDWGQRIAMIALTGWGQEEDRRKSQEAGFDGHLVKPIDHATLNQYLARPLKDDTLGHVRGVTSRESKADAPVDRSDRLDRAGA